MAFYLIPPSGHVGIDLLRKWTIARAKFLRDVYDCQDDKRAMKQLMLNGITATDYQYLIEGTSVDSVTHFVLRLACAGDYAAEHIFMTAEISLFCYRLRSLSETRVKHFVRQFHQLRKYFLNSTEVSKPSVELGDVRELLSVLDDRYIDWKSVVDGYVSFAVDRFDCSHLNADYFYIPVPFRFMQQLVAKRKVLLNKGMALLTPSQLLHIFAAVFQKWLKYGIQLARMWQPHVIAGDGRFKPLFTACRVLLRGSCVGSRPHLSISAWNGIRCDDIDNLVARFPPCMRHLHNCLRHKHRLRHMSRITYTLFLKDVGLSANEALLFWSDEYCKPVADDGCSGSHGCEHSWHRQADRYTYSVRHLYGLVGKRANYKSYSCQTIQNQLWAVGEEASCPFKHHSRVSLCQLLQPSSESVLHKICSLVDAGDYSGACRLHLDSLTAESCSDICNSICSSSNTAGKSLVCEIVSADHTDGGQSDVQAVEMSDIGYDSAHSCQPMQNNCLFVSPNQSRELATKVNRLSCNVQRLAMSAMSRAHKQCNSATAVTLKLDDYGNDGICDVQQHIVGLHCDTVARKLRSPVDFYTSFSCLVTGLQSHAVS